MVTTADIQALPGWTKLVSSNSPLNTNRFVREIGNNIYEIIDVGSLGAPETWYVERLILRSTSRYDDMPYFPDSEVINWSNIVYDQDKDMAFDTARALMASRKPGSGQNSMQMDPEFDMF
jgi:hypothetical protein